MIKSRRRSLLAEKKAVQVTGCSELLYVRPRPTWLLHDNASRLTLMKTPPYLSGAHTLSVASRGKKTAPSVGGEVTCTPTTDRLCFSSKRFSSASDPNPTVFPRPFLPLPVVLPMQRFLHASCHACSDPSTTYDDATMGSIVLRLLIDWLMGTTAAATPPGHHHGTTAHGHGKTPSARPTDRADAAREANEPTRHDCNRRTTAPPRRALSGIKNPVRTAFIKAIIVTHLGLKIFL